LFRLILVHTGRKNWGFPAFSPERR
jgi:hypothetical protein